MQLTGTKALWYEYPLLATRDKLEIRRPYPSPREDDVTVTTFRSGWRSTHAHKQGIDII